MFKPETLVRVTLQIPEPYVSAATGVLMRFKLLHLIRVEETPLGRLGYAADTDGSLIGELEELSRRVEADLKGLGLRPDGLPLREEVIPEKEVFKIRGRLEEIHGELAPVLDEAADGERLLADKRTLLEGLKLLPAELDLGRLHRCELVFWRIGLAPAQGLERLEESLAEVHHALIELAHMGERTLTLAFGLAKDASVCERALQGAFFEPLSIPAEASGIVQSAVARLQTEIQPLEARAASSAGRRQALRQSFGDELLLLRTKIEAARQILSARRAFGKVDSSYLITGWVPERLFDALGEDLKRATEGHLIFEKVAPEDLRQVREGIVRIPILFNNPLLISPFEKLTTLYGTPRYREVEPTALFALSFLLLFGMMFGDVGQGGVLFLLGYVLFRRSLRYLGYGIILMECGLASVLFGFLYGTVFGLETLLPALWFRPMENIPYFVKVTLLLGMALVSLALAVNLVNAFRLKEHEKLLSASGLTGALLYWTAAGLALRYSLTGQVAPAELRVFGWTAAALAILMVLQGPLNRLLFRKESAQRAFLHAGLGTELLEAGVELFDDLLRFVANTVSFLRVAAFALSHAALFTAVFSIANLVSRGGGGGVSYWLVVAVGNAVIICLEGLVVSIQAVRLEYYEFFGKFFRGGGERFQPFGREAGAGELER